MEVIKIIINNNMENEKLFNNYFKIITTLLVLVSLQSFYSQTSDNTNTSITNLQALNLINVTIGGDFPLSGSYPASRTERVDQLITRILEQYKAELFKVTPDEKILGMINQNADRVAKRNIVLKRVSGKKINIDLVKFRLTGDFTYNPYLQNDDVIIFPPLDLERNFVSISGAVNKETKFEFVEGERLSDAISIAMGINPAFKNVDSARISRLSSDGNNEEILKISIKDDPLLKRGDRIKILSSENKKFDFSVLVLGEVNNPGKVFITKDNSKLSDVIKKAGGLTNKASLKFAEIVRNYNSLSLLKKKALEENLGGQQLTFEDEEKLLRLGQIEFLKMYRSAEITLDDTLFFGIDNSLRNLEGSSKIDLTNLNDPNSFAANYIVKNKDVILIPEKRNEVYVWGGVTNVGFYKYDSAKTVKNYIDDAGGFSEVADGPGEIYLIKGQSRAWININESDNHIIEPGDFIYVKKDPPKSFGFYLSRVGSIASIVGTIATIVLLINQFK